MNQERRFRGRLRACLSRGLVVAGLAGATALVPAAARAEGSGPMPADVGFDPRFGEKAPLGATLADEEGRAVALGDLVGGERPVVLVMAYYTCPMLCNLVLEGLSDGLDATGLEPGRDYEVVVVSIDPEDTPERARRKEEAVVSRFHRPVPASAIHFLTGTEAEIRAVAQGIGFRYEYDPVGKQYAHAAGAVVLTPDGTISRYLYGIDFAPRDLRLALVEAGGGKVGTAGDRLLLLCFHYDPRQGRYGALALGGVRALGALTVIVLGAWVIANRRGQRPARGQGGER
ncbi:MAG: SCO family protein [Polyangiaceae bacterium]